MPMVTLVEELFVWVANIKGDQPCPLMKCQIPITSSWTEAHASARKALEQMEMAERPFFGQMEKPLPWAIFLPNQERKTEMAGL